MLPEHLVSILACPVCKGNLKQAGDGQWLLCSPCGLKFPIREGIPVMLVEEALPSRT